MFLHREVCLIVFPRQGLGELLTRWPEITRRLAETKRRRRRALQP